MKNERSLGGDSDSPRGYFLNLRADWGLMTKIGFAFIAIVLLCTFFSLYPEGDNQRKSFQTALQTLAKVDLAQPVAQRRARLLKTKNQYSWRALLWVREDGKLKPYLWEARILKEGDEFIPNGLLLEPYNQEKAFALEVFDDADSPPAP